MIDYIFSDEERNSKGYIILTPGIDLTEFNNNPVVLKNHNIDAVVGRAVGTRINPENIEQLIGSIEFDEENEDAVKVMKQVEKNLIKHTSIGIKLIEGYETFIDEKETVVITKCILKEVSVTPLPANKNAVKLTFDGKDILNTDELIELNIIKKDTKMTNTLNELKSQLADYEIKLTDVTANKDLLAKTVELKDEEIEKLKNSVIELQFVVDETKRLEAELKFNHLLEEAIKLNKITENQKENFLKLSYEQASLIINGLESKVAPEIKLSELVSTDKNEDNKTFEWYQTNDKEGLKLMFQNDIEKYHRLYKQSLKK